MHISADVQRITLNASCMSISGGRTEQLNIICRVTDFTSDFLSFIVVEHIRFFHRATDCYHTHCGWYWKVLNGVCAEEPLGNYSHSLKHYSVRLTSICRSHPNRISALPVVVFFKSRFVVAISAHSATRLYCGRPDACELSWTAYNIRLLL